MGLILDSSVVIAAERRGDTVTAMLKEIIAATGDQRAALSAVGLTELVHGIYRAQTAEARNRRDAFVRELLNDVDVYPFMRDTALLAGRLEGEQQSRGVTIPFIDLLIGATALEVGYSLLTVNAPLPHDSWPVGDTVVVVPVRPIPKSLLCGLPR